MIFFPEGKIVLSGAVNLSSNMYMYLAPSSTFLGVEDFDGYPLVQPLPSFPVSTGKNSNPRYMGLVGASHAVNVGILGEGVVDGNGAWWWNQYHSFLYETDACEHEELPLERGAVRLRSMQRTDGSNVHPPTFLQQVFREEVYEKYRQMIVVELEKARSQGALREMILYHCRENGNELRTVTTATVRSGLAYTRPRLVEFLYCTNITITGVTIQQSPFWTVHLYNSTTAQVTNVSILNAVYSPNTDGIDIDSSKRVKVEASYISVADDHIAIKSGEGDEGAAYNSSTENIVISDMTLAAGGGIAFGSETAADVHDLLIRNVSYVLTTSDAIRIKSCPHYKGLVSNILFDGVSVSAGSNGIYINQNYECHPPPSPSPPACRLTNLGVRNLHGLVTKAGDMECDYDGACRHFTFTNVHLTHTFGFHCTNVSKGFCRDVHPSCCF